MSKWLQALLCTAIVSSVLPSRAQAQATNSTQAGSTTTNQGRVGLPTATALRGGCRAIVTWRRSTQTPPTAALPITVLVDQVGVGDGFLPPGEDSVEIKLGVLLERGHRVSAIAGTEPPTVSEERSPSEPDKGQAVSKDGCPPRLGAKKAEDNRGDLDLLVYSGVVIDTFTPADNPFFVQVDPKTNGEEAKPADKTTSRAQGVVGVDFSYRLTNENAKVQLWLSGESVYGTKTDEVAVPTGIKPDEYFRKVIEANSLEVYVAPRLEFWTLKKDEAPLALYATARFGMMALKDAKEIAQSHHIGAGGIIIDGTFEGSLFEIGWGKSTQFVNPDGEPKWDRLKIDTLVAVEIGSDTGMYGFFQVYIDTPLTDRKRKASSIQTFIGVELEMSKFAKLWGGK